MRFSQKGTLCYNPDITLSKWVHPKFKEAGAYGVFYSHRIGLAVILSEAKNLVVHREMRCFAALSMTRLRFLLTRLKFWMHPSK